MGASLGFGSRSGGCARTYAEGCGELLPAFTVAVRNCQPRRSVERLLELLLLVFCECTWHHAINVERIISVQIDIQDACSSTLGHQITQTQCTQNIQTHSVGIRDSVATCAVAPWLVARIFGGGVCVCVAMCLVAMCVCC